jgi:hypothetical protein
MLVVFTPSIACGWLDTRGVSCLRIEPRNEGNEDAYSQSKPPHPPVPFC